MYNMYNLNISMCIVIHYTYFNVNLPWGNNLLVKTQYHFDNTSTLIFYLYIIHMYVYNYTNVYNVYIKHTANVNLLWSDNLLVKTQFVCICPLLTRTNI